MNMMEDKIMLQQNIHFITCEALLGNKLDFRRASISTVKARNRQRPCAVRFKEEREKTVDHGIIPSSQTW
jgi:hypothetical protein